MPRTGDRRVAVRCAATVIRATALSDDELQLQLESLWTSGYQAGRKAIRKVEKQLVSKGVASIKRMRSEAHR